jgi:hypothetical protein
MPAVSALTPEQWEEVKTASVAGISDDRLSKEFCVSVEAIRQRRKRAQWPTQLRAEREREKARQALQNKAKAAVVKGDGAETIVTEGHSTPTALGLVGKSLAEMAELYPLEASKYLYSKLQETVTNDLLPAPSSWKEANTADQMLRRNLGLDKPQTEVNVSLWSTQQPQSERDVTPSHADDVMDSMLD